jgi:predicted RecA/RadA family phage recombinase
LPTSIPAGESEKVFQRSKGIARGTKSGERRFIKSFVNQAAAAEAEPRITECDAEEAFLHLSDAQAKVSL